VGGTAKTGRNLELEQNKQQIHACQHEEDDALAFEARLVGAVVLWRIV